MASDPRDALAKLLEETADAHHEAFRAVDGEDPEWPRWYADHMLPTLTGTAILPVRRAADLPWLSVEQMAEADRLAIEEFSIGLLQMMEHAGSLLADLVMRTAPTGAVTVLAGGGNNGGGGLAAARHLADRGREVQVVLASDRLGETAAHHLVTLRAMGIEPAATPSGDIAVDALVGYGLRGPLRGRAAELAVWASAHHAISLDFPSGHGQPGAVAPAATLTLALPKADLRDVRPLYLGDLGLPRSLWLRMGLDPGAVFSDGPLVRIVD